MLLRTLLSFLIISTLFFACNDESEREGDRFFARGEYEKAIEAYNDYLEYQPAHLKSIYNRGRSYEELGDKEKAKDDYQTVLKADPSNVNASLSIGKLYYTEEDYENAIFFFENAIEESTDENAMAFMLKGRANHKLGNVDEAMEDYNAAISIDNELGEAYLYRGALKMHQKKASSACQDFRKAQSLDVAEAENAINNYCN